jgi:alpha-amylase
MHLRSGDTVPDTREPGGDRSFVPSDTPQVWIKQGDPTVYQSQPGTG